MNEHGNDKAASGRRRGLTVAVSAWLAVLVVASTWLVAQPAAAASTTPGDFSAIVPPQTRYVDDCRVEIGPVFDSVAYPYYRKIGGVRVNCGSVHRFVDATVALGYWDGSRWVQYGSSAYGIRYNTTGSGSGLYGILRTTPFCFGTGNRGYYWSVHATVRTERVTTVVASDWQVDGAGC